jgi:hypothetical protein
VDRKQRRPEQETKGKVVAPKARFQIDLLA